MQWRSAVIRVPRNARSTATASKIQFVPRQILRSEADRDSGSDAFRTIPAHFTSQQCPQSRPHITPRLSRPRTNKHDLTSPQLETEPRQPHRLLKFNYKERSPRSGHAIIDTDRANSAETSRWHKDQREREGRRRLQPERLGGDLYIPSTVSVGHLAKLLNIRLRTLQRKMIEVGMHNESAYDYVLNCDYAALLVQEFGRNPIINDEVAFDLYPPPPSKNRHLLPTRPPIVAIMGHVDHGKTTLLDNLRSSSVAASEAGGITQHIGAFCVPLGIGDSPSTSETDERLITFLDTPGHAAFSAMRARGITATDIVVLVVAADDGVMPQTLEVIELVQREKEASNIGMVIAINKIDKPEADVERTKLALLSAGVPLEDGGGDVPCVTISGLTGSGLPELVETIALVADVMDLRAEQDCNPVGYVLESRILKGFGPVATVLVTRGTLAPGTALLAGTSPCSTRRLLSPSLQSVGSAEPGTPVLVTGWKSLPAAGEEVLAGSEANVKKACANRERRRDRVCVLSDAEAINAARQADKDREERERATAHKTKRNRASIQATENNIILEEAKKHLRIIVKGDVSGSVEALVGAIKDIGNHLAGVKVISTGVGDVSDSDIMMAKAADAMIVAFSVNVPRAVRASASQNHVSIYMSNIIYRAIDDVRDRVLSLLPCTYEFKVTGEAKVLQVFEIQTKGSYKRIAGCRVNHGIVQRSGSVRVLRDERIVYEGSVDALRQQKKEVIEVRKGSECGVNLKDFDNLQEGDVIQTFQKIEIPGEL